MYIIIENRRFDFFSRQYELVVMIERKLYTAGNVGCNKRPNTPGNTNWAWQGIPR